MNLLYCVCIAASSPLAPNPAATPNRNIVHDSNNSTDELEFLDEAIESAQENMGTGHQLLRNLGDDEASFSSGDLDSLAMEEDDPLKQSGKRKLDVAHAPVVCAGKLHFARTDDPIHIIDKLPTAHATTLLKMSETERRVALDDYLNKLFASLQPWQQELIEKETSELMRFEKLQDLLRNNVR